MSRSTKQQTLSNEDITKERYYIGRHKPVIQVEQHTPLHWYEAEQLGYKAKAWPKRYNDCDDDRYNLKEKEE
jgi:hypothetical protein